jgi:hypothetical protein
MKKVSLLISAVIFLLSCGPSTKIEKSWRDPESSISNDPKNKFLVMAMVKDESSRRVIEDELVKRLKGMGTPSYTIITPELMKNSSDATLDSIVNLGHYTHILMMRLADVEKETYYVPGTTTAYYGGYGRYYGYGANFYTSPGYYNTDKNYFIETTVYTVTPNKLIWTGTTKTINPSNLKKSVNEIADVVAEQMRKEGFLK